MSRKELEVIKERGTFLPYIAIFSFPMEGVYVKKIMKLTHKHITDRNSMLIYFYAKSYFFLSHDTSPESLVLA